MSQQEPDPEPAESLPAWSLAAGAAYAAVQLVEVNLAVGPDDPRATRARAAARSASESAHYVPKGT